MSTASHCTGAKTEAQWWCLCSGVSIPVAQSVSRGPTMFTLECHREDDKYCDLCWQVGCEDRKTITRKQKLGNYQVNKIRKKEIKWTGCQPPKPQARKMWDCGKRMFLAEGPRWDPEARESLVVQGNHGSQWTEGIRGVKVKHYLNVENISKGQSMKGLCKNFILTVTQRLEGISRRRNLLIGILQRLF